MVNVHDLNGKLVFTENMGIVSATAQNKMIQIPEAHSAGLYVVSVFVDNYVLNEKVFIK